MKIVVVGNCQARPVLDLMRHMAEIEFESSAIVIHLAKPDDAEAHHAQMEHADAIIAQLTQDSYPVEHIRSSAIKSRFPNKTLVWPNLYYRGYNPELIYMRRQRAPTLNGPMGDYHSSVILDSWHKGLTVAATAQLVEDPQYNHDLFSTLPQSSLEELTQRETSTDIVVTDYIEEKRYKHKLFHTFNHPSLDFCVELVTRMLKRMDHPCRRRISAGMLPEPLGQFQLPINVGFRENLSLRCEMPQCFRGLAVENIENELRVIPNKIVFYTTEELIATYFTRYDAESDFCTDFAKSQSLTSS